MTASPRDVVERYNLELWNQQRFELADELIADTLVRHDFGTRRVMAREEARERASAFWSANRHFFITLLQVIAEGEYVCVIYEAETVDRDGEADVVSSIEVFRVQEGQITEVWNNQRTHARWA